MWGDGGCDGDDCDTGEGGGCGVIRECDGDDCDIAQALLTLGLPETSV